MPTDLLSQFTEEFQELISRYKNALTNAQLMSTMQRIIRKELDFHSRHWDPKELNKFIEHMRNVIDNKTNHCSSQADCSAGYAKGFPVYDEIDSDLKGDWVVSDKEPL